MYYLKSWEANCIGNSLDFFRSAEEVLSNMEQALKSFQFFHDDIELLEGHIERGVDLVLYLTDNAGEIYFDQVCIAIWRSGRNGRCWWSRGGRP